jgi:acid phosphatase
MRLGITVRVAAAVLATACLAHDNLTPPINTGGGGGASGIPQFQHVVLVVEENKNYSSVLGDSTAAPYFHLLSKSNGLATQYYANTHPSIGNYFMMTTGQIITNDDSWHGTVTDDNIVRELVAAGKTWKAYAEDLPSVGYLGYGETGNYAARHNPVIYFSDVRNDSTQARNVVPFTQFAADLAAGTLPNFSLVVPNLCNDAHDCSVATADAWLAAHMAPLVASPAFQQDGLLIVVFDEAGNDNTNGGGRVVWTALSPKMKPDYESTTLYQHESTLRLVLEALGVQALPGAAASAPGMTEFFAGN